VLVVERVGQACQLHTVNWCYLQYERGRIILNYFELLMAEGDFND
jgi:hypothetical protein